MKRLRDIFIGILIGCTLMATPVLAESVLTKIDVVMNGVNVQLEGADVQVDSILYNGTTYLPMRKIAELVGKNIDWNQQTRTANIIEKTEVREGDNVTDNSNSKIDKITKTENGIIINGIEYYEWSYVQQSVAKYEGFSIYPNGKDGDNTKITLAKLSKVLIESVPYMIYENEMKSYISKDYFENTILPLIK